MTEQEKKIQNSQQKKQKPYTLLSICASLQSAADPKHTDKQRNGDNVAKQQQQQQAVVRTAQGCTRRATKEAWAHSRLLVLAPTIYGLLFFVLFCSSGMYTQPGIFPLLCQCRKYELHKQSTLISECLHYHQASAHVNIHLVGFFYESPKIKGYFST